MQADFLSKVSRCVLISLCDRITLQHALPSLNPFVCASSEGVLKISLACCCLQTFANERGLKREEVKIVYCFDIHSIFIT
jgi:hypothetical protein